MTMKANFKKTGTSVPLRSVIQPPAYSLTSGSSFFSAITFSKSSCQLSVVSCSFESFSPHLNDHLNKTSAFVLATGNWLLLVVLIRSPVFGATERLQVSNQRLKLLFVRGDPRI